MSEFISNTYHIYTAISGYGDDGIERAKIHPNYAHRAGIECSLAVMESLYVNWVNKARCLSSVQGQPA